MKEMNKKVIKFLFLLLLLIGISCDDIRRKKELIHLVPIQSNTHGFIQICYLLHPP